MIVAVEAMNLQLRSGSASAGTPRAAIGIVLALARRAGIEKILVFMDHQALRPPEWADESKIEVRPVTKFRTHRLIGGFEARRAGARVVLQLMVGEEPLPGLRSVLFVHDLYPLTHPEWFDGELGPMMARRLTEQIGAARHYLCNSEWTESELHRLFPRTRNRTTVTWLGPGVVNLAKDGLVSPPEGPYILTISTIEPRKNLPRLLEGFARLTSVIPEVKLVVVGARGWLEGEVFQTYERLGLGDKVVFTGYLPDGAIPVYLRGARVFTMASLDEGFGLPLLEAMAAGTPCVVSDAGSLPEIGGDAVRLFDPLDESAIARSLGDGLRDEEWRDAARERGRARAALFTWDAAGEATERALRTAS